MAAEGDEQDSSGAWGTRKPGVWNIPPSTVSPSFHPCTQKPLQRHGDPPRLWRSRQPRARHQLQPRVRATAGQSQGKQRSLEAEAHPGPGGTGGPPSLGPQLSQHLVWNVTEGVSPVLEDRTMTTLTARTQGERRASARREAPSAWDIVVMMPLLSWLGVRVRSPRATVLSSQDRKGWRGLSALSPQPPTGHSDPSSPLTCNPILDKFLLSGALSPGTWPGDPSEWGRGYGGGDETGRRPSRKSLGHESGGLTVTAPASHAAGQSRSPRDSGRSTGSELRSPSSGSDQLLYAEP